MEYLSDAELYYSTGLKAGSIAISGEEKDHIIKVMRHSKGDKIYITDGMGKIYKSEITGIFKDHIIAEKKKTLSFNNIYSNYFFCIPKLRNPERFEFALEKAVEMGITKFIIYNAIRGVAKGEKKERWEKIVVSAMKQSLRSYKPDLIFIKSLDVLNSYPGIKIILEQNSPEYLNAGEIKKDTEYYFIFGPEGGLDNKEKESIDNYSSYKLAPNRLRTETAVIKTAALLTIEGIIV